MSARVDSLTRSDVYLQAAALIRARGLASGWYEVEGRLCASGAIRTVIFGSPEPPPILDPRDPATNFYFDVLVVLGEYLRRKKEPDYITAGATVANWSDRNDAEHVIAVLHAAASAVRVTP